MLRIFRFSIFFWIIAAGPGIADPVSRTLPSIYDEEILPQLTPAESLLKLPPPKAADASGGEVILHEQVVLLDANGGRIDTTHNIYRATAESGVKAISRDVENFHKKRSKIHLALARTLQPDGRTLPVRGEAAFIQTPQRSADSDLYDDEGELVIIYPDVKKGSAAESIVVREEPESRIPGQLTLTRGFAAGWPLQLDRFILEVPRAMADRLRFTNLGSGVPEPTREEVKEGARIRWTWERRNIPGQSNEEDRVSVVQTGPMVFISTLQNWEEFLAWYLPQAERNMVLSEALKAQIDRWTKDSESAQETTAILLGKVAKDVRYVGLEFGTGDLVPRDVNTTWENQYGDCKDKACLLAAMLRHKNIQACPALINTDFPGRVEKRSPDFRHFDHCITAVKGPDGNWLFCDPTIPGLDPGGIGPADGDREVLLVQAGREAEWARTPPHEFGLLRHRMDLRMDAAGALSGWATIEAGGYNASRYAGREEKATPESFLDSLQSQLSRLSEGLSAVDVKKYPRRDDGTYQVDAYILIPGNGAATLPFLSDKNFIPQTGNQETRETTFATWKEVYEAEARITLPPGLAPAALPDSLESKTDWAEARGFWEWKDGVLTSKFRFHSKISSIAPADFPAFCRQMRAVNAWIGRALPLKPGGSDGTPPPAADNMESLPHLPSVDGQLLLVDNKYPLGGNAGLRRLALEKSITYFPGNQAMLYRAGCHLAWLDISGGDPAAGLKRLDSFQESCRAHVDADEAALGDYFRANALKDLEKKDEALSLYRRMAADKNLNLFRRTWSCHQTAILLEESSPEEALTACLEGMALQDSGSEAILYLPWVRLMLKAGRTGEVETVLGKLAADRTEAAPAILTYLASQTPRLPAAKAREFLDLLARIGPPDTISQDYVKALSDATAEVLGGSTGDLIRDRLAAFLKKHPDSSDAATVTDGVKTAAQMQESLSKILEGEIPDLEAAIKLGIGSILKSEPGTPLSTALFNLLKVANVRDGNAADKAATSPLLDELIAIARELPKSDNTYFEGLYIQMKVQRRRGEIDRMKATARAMMADADPSRPWTALAPLKLLLDEAAEAGERTEVLELCQELRRYPDTGFALDALFQEAAVHILNGDYDKALISLDELSGKTEAQRTGMSLHEQAEALLTFVKADREAAVKWWKDSGSWWPTVLKAAKKIHPDTVSLALPFIPSSAAAGREAGVSAGKKDFAPVAAYVLRLTGAGRLDPAYFAAYAGICSQSANLNLQWAGSELNQSICAVEPFITAGPGMAVLLVFVEEAWFREKNWPKTAATAKRYFAIAEKLDNISGYAARYWSVASEQTGRDYGEVVGAFKKILEAKADPGERPRNLWLCAHILTQDGRQDEARTLVKMELAGGQLDDKHPMMPQLREIMASTTRGTTMNEREITAARLAVEQWMKVAAPAWFEWMSPPSLMASELKDAKKWLEQNTSSRPAPALKAAVLILRDPEQSSAVREEAITTFLSTAPGLASDPPHRQAEWEAIFNTDGLPEESRGLWLALHFFNFTSRGWPVSLKSWQEHPLLGKAPEVIRPRIERTRHLLGIGFNDVPKIKEFALSTLKESPDSGGLRDFATAMDLLTNLDRSAAGEALSLLKQTSLPPDAGPLAESITLETTQKLAGIEQLEPVHAALLAVLRKYSGEEVPTPTAAGLLANEQTTPGSSLEDQSRLALLRWQFQNKAFAHHSLEIWEQFVLCLDRHRKDAVLAHDLAKAALSAAESDEAAAAAIQFATYCLDVDDGVQREQLAELFKPLATKTDWPDTAGWLTFHEAVVMLRTGAGTDATEAIEAIGDRALKGRLIRMQLGALMAHDQKPRLKKLLAATPTVILLSPVCLPVSLPAWRSLGMKEECSVAEARNKAALRNLLENAWPAHDIAGINYALHWIRQTGDASLIPPGLEDDLSRWVTNPVELGDALFTLAGLREDWENAAKLGIKAIENRPAEYSGYFHAAKACAKTQRKEEAIRYLIIYLEKTHDELSVPEAKALLKALQP